MIFTNSIAMPTIVLTTAAAALLLLSLLPIISDQFAYSQMNMPGSQNLSSLLKNLLKPQKEVSGHYSNLQFKIADIVFPDGWQGRELPLIAGLIVIMHPGNEKINHHYSLCLLLLLHNPR
jgi:hypothetical protein